jgi:putative ABC transport system substrate-binding protein
MPGRRQLIKIGLAVAGCGVPGSWPALASRPRIGFLSLRSLTGTPEVAAFEQALSDLGYQGQRAVEISYRSGLPTVMASQTEDLGLHVKRLVDGGVRALVATPDEVIRLAKQTTTTVPIVMISSGDPVHGGLVASLPRPGGNVTGVAGLVLDLAPKRLEILKATIPGLRRVGFLWGTEEVDEEVAVSPLRVAAQALDLELVPLPTTPPTFRTVLNELAEAASARRLDALIVGFHPVQSAAQPQIVGLVAGQRLPTIYVGRSTVVDGGLMSYGPDAPGLFRQAAGYVDKILKGARPADLPVEQPARIDFVVNLKTAQSLGLTVPRSVLQQATELIQ